MPLSTVFQIDHGGQFDWCHYVKTT